jgi:RNA polymerase sigma-70 factor (ECF subfamily)
MTPAEWEHLLGTLAREVANRGAADATQPGERAWRELRRQIERAARLYASRDDLEDVVQNVLVKLQSAEALRRLRAARSPAGYLAVMVRNSTTDLVRKRPGPEAQRNEDANHLPDYTSLQQLALNDRAAALRHAIARLADGDRLLLRLRFWDDLSIAEIAARVGVPYSTAAVRLFRAQRRLKAELDAWLQ